MTLSEDSRLCPHCPLVVCCEIPFLPVGAWALGGAPTSAARFVERAAPLGRMHERPLTPTGSPVEAADRIVVPEVWRGVVPDRQSPHGRSLGYREAIRASRPAIGADDAALVDLATACAADLDAIWRRVAPETRRAALGRPRRPLRGAGTGQTDGRVR